MQVLAITKNNLIKIMLELRIGYIITNMFAGLITHFLHPLTDSYGLRVHLGTSRKASPRCPYLNRTAHLYEN